MEIAEVQSGDVLVLAPDGSLSSTEESQGLDARLSAAIGKGARRVVLDCAHVDALSGPALRALLLASRRLTRSGGRLVLCGMNAKVQKAFTISGFDRDFTVLPSRVEAVPAAEAPAGGPGARKGRPAPSVPKAAATPERLPAAGPPAVPSPPEIAAQAPPDGLGSAVPVSGAAAAPPRPAVAPAAGAVPAEMSTATLLLASRLMSLLGESSETVAPSLMRKLAPTLTPFVSTNCP